jgi:hypothetical protein
MYEGQLPSNDMLFIEFCENSLSELKLLWKQKHGPDILNLYFLTK